MALPPLFDRLRLPVIGAPLFIISVPDLVIAQCKAGIVGSFPALNARPDTLLDELPPDVTVRFVDFHAELTSEKMAMGWYLDGRVSAIVGTHTHIPTADTRILANGTAYQTDVGMTGPYHSVIGVDKDIILQRFLTQLPVRMEAARHGAELHAVIVEVDESTGKAASIRRHTVQ